MFVTEIFMNLRYSVFGCYIKTTSTASSNTSMYVSVEECKKNIETMNPMNWYRTQRAIQLECQELASKQRFVHMRFELPDTAPSLKFDFKSGAEGMDYIICVNLDSEIATKFFGERFVTEYKKYTLKLMNK